MSVGGVWSAIVNFAVFATTRAADGSVAEAMANTFVCLVLVEFFKAYNFRSDRRSVFDRPFANRWLNLAVTWEMLLLIAIVYAPFLQDAFGTVAFTPIRWIILVGVAASVVPVLEVAKWMERRGWFGEMD
jgi:Ca2+-transporting ATPase